MTLPLISVVIPTYNRPEALKLCLSALTRQCFEGHWEVIVVDDGSDDSPEVMVSSFKNQLNVVFLRQPNNGPATARNTGAQQAKGDYLAFLDDDCEPYTHWLSGFIPHLEPGVLLGGRTENKLTANLYSETSQHLVSYLYQYFHNTPWYFFTSNNFVMDKMGFLDVGGFDSSFRRSAGEDRAFCVYWAKRGKRLRYVPEAKILHAHDLTLFKFCKLHLKYGQAAKQFRAKLQQWGVEPVPTKPSFYSGLLAFTYKRNQYSMWRKSVIFILLIISQICVFFGATWAKSEHEINHHR